MGNLVVEEAGMWRRTVGGDEATRLLKVWDLNGNQVESELLLALLIV
jgi:hypothetical protein